MIRRLTAGYVAVLAMLQAFTGLFAEAVALVHLYDPHEAHRQMCASRDRAQSDIVGVAIALIIVGAVVFVGINIMSQTITQTALNPANASGAGAPADPFYNASVSFQGTMGDMFGFIGLALLAAFLAVIIYYLTSVRGSGGGMGGR